MSSCANFRETRTCRKVTAVVQTPQESLDLSAVNTGEADGPSQLDRGSVGAAVKRDVAKYKGSSGAAQLGDVFSSVAHRHTTASLPVHRSHRPAMFGFEYLLELY